MKTVCRDERKWGVTGVLYGGSPGYDFPFITSLWKRDNWLSPLSIPWKSKWERQRRKKAWGDCAGQKDSHYQVYGIYLNEYLSFLNIYSVLTWPNEANLGISAFYRITATCLSRLAIHKNRNKLKYVKDVYGVLLNTVFQTQTGCKMPWRLYPQLRRGKYWSWMSEHQHHWRRPANLHASERFVQDQFSNNYRPRKPQRIWNISVWWNSDLGT